MNDTLIEGSWCHLVWQTAGRRAVFKLAEHAAFCERLLATRCRTIGWRLEAVTLAPDTLQALFRVTGRDRLSRRAHTLLGDLARRLRAERIGPPWPRRFWQRAGWCVPIGTPGAAARIRRHLRAVRSLPAPGQYASSQRAARTTSSTWGST